MLRDWGIDSHSEAITLNYNNTNANDIYADEEVDEVDFLRDYQFYDDEQMSQMSESQTHMSESQTQIDENLLNQISGSSSRSNEHNVIHPETEHTYTFISDNASDISKALRVYGQFQWFGCAGHHLNLIVRDGFKKNQPAAKLLKKCKLIVTAVNHSQPILYDVKQYQDELDIPISAIMQEMTTRWWSILNMLVSILKSIQPIILALVKYHKSYLVLEEDEQTKVKELIALLQPFKHVGEQFGKESDVTLTSIVPMFEYLKTKILNQVSTDSQMIKDMKKHMLAKLETRYNVQQMNFLKTATYLDPRVKSQVNLELLHDLKSKVKVIVQAAGPNVIPPTQNQEYINLQSTSFTTPTASSSRPSTPSHSLTLTAKDNLFDSVYSSDDSDEEVPDISQLDEKIEQELHFYKSIKLTREQKKNTHLLTWWKDHKSQFPCLFQAVKPLLVTPATSVPSERIFSEAGYIARARRSRILPKNLNKFIFIKKNMKYVPKLSKQDLSQEMAGVIELE